MVFFWKDVDYRKAIFELKKSATMDKMDGNAVPEDRLLGTESVRTSDQLELDQEKRRGSALANFKHYVRQHGRHISNAASIATMTKVDQEKNDGYTIMRFLSDSEINDDAVIFGHKIFHIPTFR